MKNVVGEGVEIRESALGLVGAGEGGGGDGSGRELRVVLIREGMAKSGRYYTRSFVEEVAAAAEGLRAFADHATPAEYRERPARSVRDVVGFYRDGAARVDEESGLLQAEATLHVFESAKWLAEAMREVLAAGPPGEVMGLSIDAVCALRMGTPPGLGREVPIAERLMELRSVDVVTRASAGGKFVSVEESEGNSELGQTDTGAETVVAQAQAALATAMETAGRLSREGERQLAEATERNQEFACRQALGERMGMTSLPAPVAKRVKLQWAYGPGKWSSAEEYTRQLEAAIDMEVASLGELRDLFKVDDGAGSGEGVDGASNGAGAAGSGTSPVRGMGGERVRIAVAESDKQRLVAQVAMDRLLGLEGGVGEGDNEWRRARELGLLPGLPRWGGIREAYVAITGDASVSGVVYPEGSIVREANEVTTGVLNHALLNSMTKRLVRDYRGQEQTWRKFCAVTPLNASAD